MSLFKQSTKFRSKNAKITVGFMFLICLMVAGFFISRSPGKVVGLEDPQHSVDTRLGDGDLKCTAPTSNPSITRAAIVGYVDGYGGYSYAEEAIDYFMYSLPGLPRTDLRITQQNDVSVRFEVPEKAVFIIAKTAENRWQPSTYSLCPNLNWEAPESL